ncbi:peptidase family C50-domain-containing protein [Lasiosphaeria ovina]|uniref:separase n=1 Tax=Lasiosphaeria ovina TaxID=92902 RepID=A0AAE0NF05_9PEZI|nr:peptidase family C50-domain-containing protein [Lasiosphaeria ovina]
MDTLRARADAVRAAVTSASTCEPATVTLLKTLLLPKDEQLPTAPIATKPPPKRSRQRANTAPATDARQTAKAAAERAALATDVVNATLKALGGASRASPPPPQSPIHRSPPHEGELAKAATRNALRRSSSAPMTPLGSQPLNRQSSSPVATRHARSPSKSGPGSATANIVALAECARIAFAAMRLLSDAGDLKLKPLQLEAGMSTLVGKLVSLELHDQAIKELRILKKRVETSAGSAAKTSASSVDTKNAAPHVMADLLDFGQPKASGALLSLIITTQIQVLRILSLTKRPTWVEAVISCLQNENIASPTDLLFVSASEKDADVGRIARQMEVVAQCLFVLVPVVAIKGENQPADGRAGVSTNLTTPDLDLVALGLETRLHWWRLAKHKGDVDREIIAPLSRCLGDYIARSRHSKRSFYPACLDVFNDIYLQIQGQKLKPSTSRGSKSPLASLYQTLTTMARECTNFADAVSWATKLCDLVDSNVDSAARSSSLAAQLLSIQLKDPALFLQNDQLLNDVVTSIQGPLRGETAELDELITNVCSVRRSAMKFLVGLDNGENAGVLSTVPTAKELTETFILQCPRFCLRWLGKPPGPKSSTKDYLRYDQRRQLLLQSIQHTIDSSFWMIRLRLDQGRLLWDLMEAILGDVTALLEYVGKLAAPDSETCYHVKISHFYYRQYFLLKQQTTDPKDPAPLRALRRSIDCVKNRPSDEKEKAQLILKLEMMAELCRTLGRRTESLGALQAIRTSLVEDGILQSIAGALTSTPPKTAWTRGEKAEALSRVLSAISKTEETWEDWTGDLPEEQQAAVLEHRLHFVLLGSSKDSADLSLEHPTVDALLRTYIPTRFPIRRFGVLLALLCSAIGKLSTSSELLAVARDASQLKGDADLGEDSSLAGFVPHMKALYHSLAMSIDGYRDPDAFQQSISSWQAMLKTCRDKAELERCVDDVPGLLDHLQSAADFLRMKGQDTVLAMVLELAANITKVAEGPRAEDFIHHNSCLALQYTNLGQSSKAEQIFLVAEEFMGKQVQLQGDAVACFHLSFTEHFLAVGNFKKAEEHLLQAQLAFGANTSLKKASRVHRQRLVAQASYLNSLVALERGDSHHALVYSRESVRSMYHEWTRLETQLAAKSPIEPSTADNTTLSLSVTDTGEDTQQQTPGPEFWVLFHSLYRNVLRLSAVYAHLGMFQETMYYAEQAEKLAKSVNTEFYMADCAAWMGSVHARAADSTKSFAMLEAAAALLPDGDRSYSSAMLACQIGSMYLELDNSEGAHVMIAKAEAIMNHLVATAAPGQAPNMAVLGDKIAKLKTEQQPAAATRRTIRQAPVKKDARAPAATKSRVVPPAAQQVAATEDSQLAKLRASILVQKATSRLGKKEWTAAIAVLKEATEASRRPDLLSVEQVAMATCLVGMSMDQMAHDPVFSVIHDSTISFPAVSSMTSDKGTPERHSVAKMSPPRKTRSGAAVAQRESPKGASSRAYVETLREAQEYLLEAHAVATLSGDSSLVHKISGMLQNVGLFLAATSARARVASHSVHAWYSVELARNLIWRRERKALVMEKNAPRHDTLEWPSALGAVGPKRTSLGFSLDLHKFQRDYVDIIPKPWSVISMSLSDNKHDLCITKLQAGQSPFVIRLPLERASSRDADNEVFNFQQGRAELIDIISQANETCHHAGDMSAKGAKTAWWAQREELDVRLKELLENIEQIWLGGFRGIFSQHARRADLLARFQKSFLAIMDKHLPSRQQVRGKKTKATQGPKVTLDSRILELFIGLGDASVPDCDFEDELTDLLYFVVDILQFHGERNAYDEIDFDSMVVETFDALHSYHASATRNADGNKADAGAHTILMLDKALHAFPWESLPCLHNLGISRVPSLACLRRLILEQRAAAGAASTASHEADEAARSSPEAGGHHVSKTSGTCILNPSSDLKTTEATFGKPLAAHLPAPSWRHIVGRVPTEDEFELALSQSDLLLYFGHGSGAQYIRARTIRRLDRCRATVLLMGCSSARLADAGEFEVYGPAWNYMMAGCPAVVGTLWDVTDRDIDRFAARLLEEWGLAPAGTFAAKDKEKWRAGQGRCTPPPTRRPVPVAGAGVGVGAGGKVYVTAAAVAVYGIPVYVES